MNGDPYDHGSHPKHYGRYEPVPTVRFTHQAGFDRAGIDPKANGTVPPQLVAWAQSNLPDGEYVVRYQIGSDMFAIIEVDASGCMVTGVPIHWWPQ